MLERRNLSKIFTRGLLMRAFRSGVVVVPLPETLSVLVSRLDHV